jgi:hypothetical protein
MPLAIDLFCGLGGWTEGLLSEGYDVVGFDIERHHYGSEKYPAQLVIQDVLTIHGAQFKNAALIVASPPCQEYSYMAMPWKLAKAKAAWLRSNDCEDCRGSGFNFVSVTDASEVGCEVCEGAGVIGRQSAARIAKLTALFDACFRIQREACEAAGRFIPMVVENVKGAQPWVGPAKANFGSFYLWGDVAMVGRRVVCGGTFGSYTKPMRNTAKVPGLANGRFPGGGLAQGRIDIDTGRKGKGSRFGDYQAQKAATMDGIKCGGDWFNDKQPSISRMCSSKSPARKAASAQIAKIPLELSSYIARAYRP